MLLTIVSFLGHFHPVLVHLPIGMLLMATVFYGLSFREKYQFLQQATGFTLLLGMISSIVTVISGYLLSISGDYEYEIVRTHQWMGIGVAVISVMAYWLYTKQHSLVRWVMVAMTILIFITGHTGGALTHGADYLWSSSQSSEEKIVRQPITEVQEALVYKDLVQPMLEEKCYGCHNERKQKGQLRLDGEEWIRKGGKDRAVVLAAHADESELIKRLLLPLQHEKHMPPKEKPQLSEKEVALLHWWINAGFPFDKKVKELVQTEQVKKILLGLQTMTVQAPTVNPYVPVESVEAADARVIKKLTERGVVILPIAKDQNYLTANFLTVDKLTIDDITLFHQISKQLVWLKLNGQPVVDEMLNSIASCEALTRLDLSGTKITDQGLGKLQTLKHLKMLNVSNTTITAKGLLQLKNLTQLKNIYLFRTAVSSQDLTLLKKSLPHVNIDTGGYHVPLLPNDTVIITKPKM